MMFSDSVHILLLLPGAELPLVESFGLLNDLFPFPSILDAGYPVLDLQLADVLFDVILHLYLGLPCDLLVRGFQLNASFNCSGIWHPLYVTKPT